MQSIDGDFDSVCRAALWTIDELLNGYDDTEGFLLHTDFGERETFELYQDPVVGWMTHDPLKLGKRAQKLTFRYCYDQDPKSVQLKSCEGAGAVSMTALKTAVLVSKLFTKCMTLIEDCPAAQPLSLSDWDFPYTSGWIEPKELRNFKHEGQIKGLWQTIKPLDPDSDCFVGRLHAEEGRGLLGPREEFSVGNIVVIKRTHTTPTYGKVYAAGEDAINVVVEVSATGGHMSTKMVRTSNIGKLILGHWRPVESREGEKRAAETADGSEERAKKRRRTEDQ